MKIVKLFWLAIVLLGCNDTSSNNKGATDELFLWNDNAQRIVIVQDNGNTPPSEDRYVTYDYSRDTLTVEAKAFLPTMRLVTDGLSCVEDGTTYEVTVTDSSGLEQTYYSSNKACNDIEDMEFISEADIQHLIPLLFTY